MQGVPHSGQVKSVKYMVLDELDVLVGGDRVGSSHEKPRRCGAGGFARGLAEEADSSSLLQGSGAQTPAVSGFREWVLKTRRRKPDAAGCIPSAVLG